MIVKPMIRNNICMNAHPAGCRQAVAQQIEYVRGKGPFRGPQNVLVIGASQGYGLASRIVAAFGAGARTIGVSFETPSRGSRTASAGWYMDRAFQDYANEADLESQSLIADAFAHDTKRAVIEMARDMMGAIDLVVYSLASGVRPDPDTGEMYRSALKTIGEPYVSQTLDSKTGALGSATIEPASPEEIENTVKVMGGEDWRLWVDALAEAGVLAPDFTTVAYSYIGPAVTFPIYRDGTIGKAKEHLERTAREMNDHFRGAHSYVSINKALVTRASAVIPGVSLYLAILYRVMKEKGLHEGTIEQIYRLYTERLYQDAELSLDDEQRIRIDDWEMRPDVQQEVMAAWDAVNENNVNTLADVEGFQSAFLQVHGFGFEGVDYEADLEV